MYGYRPDFTIPAGKRTNIPSLDKHLANLAKIRKETEAALRITKARMKEQYEQGKKAPHIFAVGDLVKLAAKDIKIHQQSPKLGPRQLGPFKVLERIGDLDYRLELLSFMKINPVFHVDCLSPWHETGIKPPPQPELIQIEGQEEWEIDEILDSRYYRRQFQYLIKWKNYRGDPSWEPWKNLEHAPDAVSEFHSKHPNAPRRLNATLYASLFSQTRTSHTEPDRSQFPTQYPDIFELDWEMGRVIGNPSREDARI